MVSWPDEQTRTYFFCLVQVTFYSHFTASESLSNAPSTTINALLKLWINITRLDQTTGGIFLPNKTLVSRLGILQPHSFLFKPEGTEIHELIIAKPVFKGLMITSWRHSPQLNNLFDSVDLNREEVTGIVKAEKIFLVKPHDIHVKVSFKLISRFRED